MKSAMEWLKVFQAKEGVLAKQTTFFEFINAVQADAIEAGRNIGLSEAAEVAKANYNQESYCAIQSLRTQPTNETEGVKR